MTPTTSIPTREQLESVSARMLSHYDKLAERGMLTRNTQAAVLEVSRQSFSNYRRRPGSIDAVTFLRLRSVCKVLEEAINNGLLPPPGKNKKHAQPAILRMFGIEEDSDPKPDDDE